MPDNLSNETILPELYFLIAHFLNNTPFKETAQLFIRQLEQLKALPARIDWTGQHHQRNFQQLSENFSHIPSNFLLQICNQLKNLTENQNEINSSTSLSTLFGIGQYSILQDAQKLKKNKEQQSNIKISNLEALPKDLYLNYHSNSNRLYLYPSSSKQTQNGGLNLILNLNRRQLDGRLNTSNIVQPEIYKSINLHKRILGHLSAVYCVCFDRTGKHILTGADDNLIKTWSSIDGRLLATFRGHEKEISDIDINFENTLLASGSCDKTIRIWNLKTTECLSILQSHSAMVTSIEFSPYCRGNTRWLASSGSDGVICFWYWNASTLEFNQKPRRFIEKSRPGGQILCLSFSSGGLFMAAGSNDSAIRVYCFENGEPSKICELESHTNWVDSIQYANRSARFLSGSKDGTAKIWSFESQQWKNILIDGSKTLQKTEQYEYLNQDICKKYSVTMVAWNCDDTLVITAQNNFLIKIWNSTDAQLIHELKGHNDEIFVLESHPKDPRLILSAGHDGHVILWNILSGKMLKKFYNRIENEGHGCFFDTKWSPNLDMFASTDSHGNLSMFGFGNEEIFKKVPSQLFFHTDYRPLMRDDNGYVLDEQTQSPPHLMPPPFLVDADGNPYNSDLQRLVPGRENLTDAQLIPHIITNENGVSEIIGDREEEDQDRQARIRSRNGWTKNLIKALDEAVLRTNESDRIESLEHEENNYKKELKEIELSHQKGSVYIYRDGENSNMGANSITNNNQTKRGRGRSKSIKTRTDLNSSSENLNINQNTVNMDYDDETQDENQYIDIDEDSNTRNSDSRNQPQSSLLLNQQQSSSNNNQRSRRTVYVQPNDLLSDSDRTSEYSDWAEQDGRISLRPPPRQSRKANKNNKNKHKRVLRVEDDDDDDDDDDEEEESNDDNTRQSLNETESPKSKQKTTISKKLKKIRNDEEEEEEMDALDAANEEEDVEDEITCEEEEEDDEEADLDEEYENDENMDPNKPCTSKAADNRASKSPRKKSKKLKKRGRRPVNSKLTKQTSRPVKITPIKECPIGYRPPEWLTSTRPRKTPYVPQIGDEVVYFRQGHELYVQAVKDYKSYEIDEKSLPWNQTNKVEVQEFCKVINIKIEIKPPRLVVLKLGVVDRGGKLTGCKFSIKYHDMDGVPDFVMLRQFYEKAIERNWRPKDRFRSIIDDVWYIGVIDSKKPFQEEYPESQFQCLKVLWDSGDSEALSPWDLESLSGGVNSRKTKPVSSNSLPSNGESIAVNLEEIKSLLYVPHADDWPGGDRDAECERILNGLEKIMELSIAEPFNFPVDLDEFPDYALVIGYPIDLNTIKERLENRYYRRLIAVEWDIRKIEEDAHDYNEPDSSIYQQSTLLTNLLLEFINDPDCSNPMPIYKRLCKNISTNETSPSHPNYNKRILRNKVKPELNTNNLRFNLRSRQNNLESASNKNETLISYSWTSDCKKLINEIMRHPDSVPFRAVVDTIEYSDYLEIVKNPIDFGTIRYKLRYNSYFNNFDSFVKDCKQVFINSKLYNTDTKSRIYSMTDRLQAFFKSKISEIIKKHEQSQAEKSKYGKTRRTKLANTDENQNEICTNIKSENNQQSSTNNNYYSSCPSTSGYQTRSSNRKIKSVNSNSNHHNDYTENSSSQFDNLQTSNLTKSSDILNRSYIDEDTQMALLDDNVEYDLNESFEHQKNSKLTKIKSENTNFSNFSFKIEKNNSNNVNTCDDTKPCISSSTNHIKSEPTSVVNSKKTRLARADSSTVLSYTDTLDNETNYSNKKSKKNSKSTTKNKKIESDEEDDDYEQNNNDHQDQDEQNKRKFETESDKSEQENYSEDEKEEEDEENDDEDESFNVKKSKKPNKKSKTKLKKKKIKNQDNFIDDNSDFDQNKEEFEDEEDEDEDLDNEDDDDFNINSKKTNKRSKKSKKSASSKSKRPVRSCRSVNQNLDNKENDNEYQETNSKNTRQKSSDGKKSIKDNSGTYSTRSSKRGRKTFYREFSSSEEDNSDDENYTKNGKKKLNSRKKPKFSSSENLNL